MADLQGLFSFPGVESFISASIAYSHGITPSVATVTMAPQASRVTEYGTMEFSFGDVVRTFFNSKADYGNAEFNEAGELWRIAILDRRWKWRYGAISGQYNVRRDDFTINPNTVKTPQQLAQLCLTAMGEDAWDLGDLPNDSRPSVDWDYANPASSLAELCDSLGCYVVPNLDELTGKICVAGTGENLPDGGYTMAAVTSDLPEMPDRIAIVCGPSVYEHDFDISEAVGLESNTAGTIRKIDELSYKPSSGWSSSNPIAHNAITNRLNRECALESVWRWFRVKIPLAGISIAGHSEKIEDWKQIRLLDGRVKTVDDANLDDDDPQKGKKKHSLVYGTWYHSTMQSPTGNAANDTIDPDQDDAIVNQNKHRTRFTIDPEKNVVKFSEPMFRLIAGSFYSPLLYLRTSCNIREAGTRALVRYTVERPTPNCYGTKTLYIPHPELAMRYTPAAPEGVNKIELEREANYYLDAALKQFTTKSPECKTYAGFVDCALDGAIQQITLDIGGSGTFMTVSRDTEQLHRTQPYRVRRRLEQQRAIIQAWKDSGRAYDKDSALVKRWDNW